MVGNGLNCLQCLLGVSRKAFLWRDMKKIPRDAGRGTRPASRGKIYLDLPDMNLELRARPFEVCDLAQ
jgi:hypothetical protein